MSEAIDSLLVRLGLESDAKQFRDAEQMFDGLKSKALQFGAVIAGGLGLNALTFGFAQAKDQMGKFAAIYGTTAQFVDSLGYALGQSGGQADEVYGSIRRVADLIERTEWGEVPSDAFRIAGFNPMLLQGVTSIAEAYERIDSAAARMSREDRRRALSALGFSEAEITLFSGDSGGLANLMAESESFAKVTKDMTDKAAEFTTSVSRLTKSVEGLGNNISALILPEITEATNRAAEFVRDNRDELTSFFEKALPFLEATAIGVAALVTLNAGGRAAQLLGPLMLRVPQLAAIGATYTFLQDNPSHFEESFTAARADSKYWARKFGEGSEYAPWYSPARYVMRWMKGYGAIPENMLDDGRYSPDKPDIGGLTPPAGNTTIHVDARGATDPRAIEEAGERGVRKALQQAAENSINDLRTGVK